MEPDPPLRGHYWVQTITEFSNCTKILQNLLNGKTTLQILPHGTKILQDLPKGGRVLGVSHSLPKVKNIAVRQGHLFVDEKSALEHNFSGMGCNSRVFKSIFPGAKKIQGSSRPSRVCWLPC